MKAFLKKTKMIDFNHPELVTFFQKNIQPNQSKKDNVIQLYLAIRDGWLYNPYQFTMSEEGLTASNIFKEETGHCISKSILLIAACRWLGIPARLRLAKVKNHIATEKLEEKMGTNELVPHGFVDIYLKEKWVKATPAFNQSLCTKLGVTPLEFDGENDSIFQEFNHEGDEFMEYLEEYGHFEDVPVEFICDIMKSHYPKFFLE